MQKETTGCITPLEELLLELLRGALGAGAPPPIEADTWEPLLRLAAAHGIHLFLYDWLRQNYGTAAKEAAEASALDNWRAVVLRELLAGMQREAQLRQLLNAFNAQKLPLIPLKGSWLAYQIYREPVERSMCDLDLLIQPSDYARARQILLQLGYASVSDTPAPEYGYAHGFIHPDFSLPLELHWRISDNPFEGVPPVNLENLWRQTTGAQLLGIPTTSFPPADLLAHLVQHILHHNWAMPLRAYLDIALLLQRHGSALSVPAIEAATQLWQTGRAIPFTLRFVSELTGVPLPSHLEAYALAYDPLRQRQSLHAIFNIYSRLESSGEATMLQLHRGTALKRLKVLWQRIFMPRHMLAAHYRCARSRWGLPLAWLLRARALCRTHHRKVLPLLRREPAMEQQLETATARRDLLEWLYQEQPTAK